METNRVDINGGFECDMNACPLPLEVIPNHMGINLSAVDSVVWQKQDDGQLTSLTIYFVPAKPEDK
jgi:hypothetical protein